MILLLPAAWAATLVVGVDAATVQATVDLAADGDTVEVPAGTWVGCLDFGGRSIALVADGAVLDATGVCDNAVRVVSGETVSITGLTVRNDGARAFDLEWSTVALTGVTVSGAGRADWQGGAGWTYGAALTTTDCVFTDNVASEGGALYHYAYTTWTDSGSRFEGNAAGGSGGAVMAYYDNELALGESTFVGNTAGYYGGGIATWSYTDLAVSSASFTGNTAPTTGGGAVFFYPTDPAYGILDVRDSTFAGNGATDGGAFWIGWAGSSSLRGNRFDANAAANTGGAVLVYVANTVSISHDLYCRNTAQWGGGVSVQWTTADTWTANRFVENTATQGGGAHRYASYGGTLRQNTFVGNAATDVGGGYYASWAYGDFRNNIVADTPSGTGIYTAEAQSYAATPVEYDGWAQNAVVDASGYFFVDDAWQGNVVADDPGFVAWSRDGDCDDDDLRLASGSPFRDVGDPSLFDLDGSRSDMGAYGGADQAPVDLDGDGADTTTDCDDTNAAVGPGASEACNGIDDDCDGVIDGAAADAPTWYADADGDGYGDPAAPIAACDVPDGAVANADDCDDGDRWVHPGASDYPGDGVDADCSGADNTQVVPEGDTGGGGGGGGGCGCAAPGDGRGAAVGAVAVALLLGARRRVSGRRGGAAAWRS